MRLSLCRILQVMTRSRALRRLSLLLVFLTSSMAHVVGSLTPGHVASPCTQCIQSSTADNSPGDDQPAILPIECESSIAEAALTFVDSAPLPAAPSIAAASLTGRLDRDATHVETLLTCGRLLI